MKQLKVVPVLLPLFAATNALAADLDFPGDMYGEQPTSEMAELGTGWYLRGDLALAKEHSATLEVESLQTRVKIKNGWSAGLGAGYQYNSMLRTELSYEGGTSDGPEYTVGPLHASSKIIRRAILGSAFLDLGTWLGVTPYIGAGGGAARSTYEARIAAVGVPNALELKHKNTTLVWTVMAGIGIDLSQHAKLDVGYRFIDYGRFTLGPNENLAGITASSSPVREHQVRASLRYMID